MAKHERRPREGSAESGYRALRLEGLFCEELNSLLDGEVVDPRLYGVRITRVELSRDGSRARAWYALPARALGEASDGDELPADARAAQAAFERAAGFLRGRLIEALPLKRAPELAFRHDPFEPADHAGDAEASAE